jgi:hypothetical protein
MSRIYFHTPSGEAELWGGEKAWLRSVCEDMAIGLLPGDWRHERSRELIAPGHDLADPRYQPPQEYLRWRNHLETALQVGHGTLAWNGCHVDEYHLLLNTVMRAGSDPVKLAARIAGQSEIHCYIEGIDRAWAAQLIDAGLGAGVFRDLSGIANAPGWDGVTRLLRDRDDEPVVLSYSISDPFPGPYAPGWTPPEDPAWMPEFYRGRPGDWAALADGERAQETADALWERWEELGAAEQWRIGITAVRAEEAGLRIDPARWDGFLFGHKLSVLDVLAPDWRERLDAAFPAPSAAVTS